MTPSLGVPGRDCILGLVFCEISEKILQGIRTKMNPRNQKRVLHWLNFPDLKCVFENHVISFDIDEDDGLDEAVAKPLDLI